MLDALQEVWVDALPSDRTAMDIINPIGDMFRNEDLFRMMKLSGEQIKEKRLKLTGPILERIHHKVVMMMQGYQNHGKRTDEKGRELYVKPVEVPEKYPQGRFGGNIEQPL